MNDAGHNWKDKEKRLNQTFRCAFDTSGNTLEGGSMSRYFFHMACKGEAVLDTDGREMTDLAAAHQYALKMIDKLLVYLPNENMNGWYVEVSNTADLTKLFVLFPWRPEFCIGPTPHGRDPTASAHSRRRPGALRRYI